MQTRHLGKILDVSVIGLGCMGMTGVYGQWEESEAIRTLRRAHEIGITLFDTAEVYGPYENEKILGKALKEVRDDVVIATKFGFVISEAGTGSDRIKGVDGRPENVKAVAEASLKRLGIDTIDLFYQHRVDPNVPIEETVGAMADLVHAGKVRGIGLSEASAETIRRAHAVHPISAVQSEYSLWTRDPEAAVLPTCKELGIGFVPFSPLGRGFLTGTVRDIESLEPNDYRRTSPRFAKGALDANLALIKVLEDLATDKGITTAQLALAWVLHQGDNIVPIPGTREIHRLEENAAAADIVLSAADLDAIAAAVPHESVVGARYTEPGMAMINR